MEKQNDKPETAATERVTAPVTTAPVAQTPQYLTPRDMDIERVGGLASGMTIVFPEVRGGICEFCGVIDGNYPSHYQYSCVLTTEESNFSVRIVRVQKT